MRTPVLLLALMGFAGAIFAGENVWTSNGPYGGGGFPVTQILNYPAEPGSVFAATPGAVFRSVNGGHSWRRLKLSDTFVVLKIKPASPGTLMAFGYFQFGLAAQFDVYESTDKGTSWQTVSKTSISPFHFDWALVDAEFDPVNPLIAYAAFIGRGIWKTTDGGKTWAEKNSGLPSNPECRQLEATPDGTLLYTLLGNGQIYVSRDKADTWNLSSSGLQTRTSLALTLDIRNQNTLYVGGEDGLFRSVDGGAHWKKLGCQSSPLAISIGKIGELYVLEDFRLLRSTDDGATCRELPIPKLSQRRYTSLTISSVQPQTILVGGGDGMLMSTNGGAGWALVNQGFDHERIESLAISSQSPTQIVAVAGHAAFTRTESGPWKAALRPACCPQYLQLVDVKIHPKDPKRIVIVGSGYAWVSSDQGRTWKRTELDWKAGRVALDAMNSDVIYLPQGRSLNNGQSWLRYRGSFFSRDRALTVSSDPQNGRSVYVGTGAGGGKILHSGDGGTTWKQLASGFGSVYTIAIAPHNSNLLYAGTGFGVYKSTNRGATWAQVNAQGMGSITIDPFNSNIIFGTESGVAIYFSQNGGISWSQFSVKGLPENTAINAIVCDPIVKGKYYAGTSSGVYEFTTH
jgi:photosystem II stability/assembly factor-like uncharacterized protein